MDQVLRPGARRAQMGFSQRLLGGTTSLFARDGERGRGLVIKRGTLEESGRELLRRLPL